MTQQLGFFRTQWMGSRRPFWGLLGTWMSLVTRKDFLSGCPMETLVWVVQTGGSDRKQLVLRFCIYMFLFVCAWTFGNKSLARPVFFPTGPRCVSIRCCWSEACVKAYHVGFLDYTWLTQLSYSQLERRNVQVTCETVWNSWDWRHPTKIRFGAVRLGCLCSISLIGWHYL